jgi:hypothetical protein
MAEEPVTAAIAAYATFRRFSAATLQRWQRLADEDQRALLDLAQRLRLGENQFRDFLDWSEEIALRDRCSLAAVWRREVLATVLARDLGRNEMIHALKAALRALRFPQLAATEERIAELIKRLDLPRDSQLQVPLNLEGDAVRLELHSRSAAALRDQVAALQRALTQPELDEIFRLLTEAP